MMFIVVCAIEYANKNMKIKINPAFSSLQLEIKVAIANVVPSRPEITEKKKKRDG